MFENIDYNELKKDFDDLKKELLLLQNNDDINHLNIIYFLSKLFLILGIFLLWLPWYTLLPWIFLSIGIFANWTMIGHHICHGGYEYSEIHEYKRRRFGLGSLYRRFVDWFDWWLVEGWNIEHNNMHHYRLGEDWDPDLVEKNVQVLRKSNIPIWTKKIVIFFMACTWKWFYYTPNTFKFYILNKYDIRNEISDENKKGSLSLVNYLFYYESWMNGFSLISIMLPYFLFYYLLIPSVYYCINYDYGYNSIINIILAEILTNIHSFIVILPNHTGSDLYRFDYPVAHLSGEFYLRQIISSVNYDTGNDLLDFSHGWLNYQIEHHLFPNLSMLSYRRAVPLVKKICKKHNIPYIQENVFIRLKKTIDIMTGKSSMKRF